MNWKQFFALWKFRLDNAVSFLVFANFLLLSITASTPITDFLSSRLGWHIEMYSIVGFLVIGIIICAFFFGFILDKVMHYTQHTMTIQNSRNPELSEILSNTRKILKGNIQKPVKCRMTDCKNNTLGLCCKDGNVIGKFKTCIDYVPQEKLR